MNRAKLKAKAKKRLKGNYKEFIKLLLFYILISILSFIFIYIFTLLLNLISKENFIVCLLNIFLNYIISAFIDGMLIFGFFSFFLKISRNKKVTYKELFSKSSYGLPYIIISLLIAVFTTLWSILFIIPGIIAAISYSMVFFVALDNPELKPMEVLRKSQELMNGYKMDYFLLELSFIGWSILGIFTLGILYFWLSPYYVTTIANFYNEIIKEA